MDEEIIIRIEGEYDCGINKSTGEKCMAYTYSVIKGDKDLAQLIMGMGINEDLEDGWLRHIIPETDHSFFVFDMPEQYRLDIGMEFDIHTGPLQATLH